MNTSLPFLSAAVLAALLLPASADGADMTWGPASGESFRIGPGLGVISRVISWDEGTEFSNLTATSFSLNAEFDLQWGISLGIRAGFSLSDYAGMFFRDLPFSLEYASGGAEGVFGGVSLKKYLFSSGDFEIGVRGEFVYNIGLKKTWPLEGLAVEGQAVGEPRWMAGWAGPTVIYKGYENFVPRITVAAEWFSGEFLMQQTVGDLKRSETKAFQGAGFLRVLLGADYRIGTRMTLTGAALLIPCKDGISTGAAAGLLLHF